MTITIELTDTEYAALSTEAETLGIPPAALARAAVRNITTKPAAYEPADDATFRAALAETMQRNAELYRRLAQ